MKKVILFTGLLLSVLFCPAQNNITHIEYFLDTDLGVGMNQVITVAIPDSDIVQTINIPLPPNTSLGYHKLYFRVEDTNGNWSLTSRRNIEIIPQQVQNNIVAAEYFIDSDQGFTLAIPFTISPQDTEIVQQFNASVLLNSSIGFHKLYGRVKDTFGSWSHTFRKNFEVVASDDPVHTTELEYFFDVDSGFGMNARVPILSPDSDITVSYNIPLPADLIPGYHKFYSRVKDSRKQWSLTSRRNVEAIESDDSLYIVEVEYFFVDSSDLGIGNCHSYQFTAPSADNEFSFAIPFNQIPVGYTCDSLFVRVKDSTQNQWSATTYVSTGPVTDYHFIAQGQDVYFFDDTKNAQGYHWNFGDGDTANIQNPYHHYDPGIYSVCLTANNFCGVDSVCKTIVVNGISAIEANHGGNTGAVSVLVKGAGFSPGVQLWLEKTGEAAIYGDTLIIVNEGLVSTGLDLTGKTIGQWDVVCVFPNGDTSKLVNGFTMEQGTGDSLWVNITGPSVLRIGFNQVYTVTYGNLGNVDAVFVPMVITGLPLGTEIELLQPTLNIDTLSAYGIDTLESYPDTLSQTIQDSTKNICYRIFYIGKIPAGSTGTLQFVFHLPLNAVLNSRPLIEVILHNPLYNSTEGLNRTLVSTTLDECNKSISDLASLELPGANQPVWKSCYDANQSLISAIEKAVVHFSSKEQGIHNVFHGVLDFLNIQFKWINLVTECSGVQGLSIGTFVKRNILAKVAGYTWEALVEYEYTMDCIGIYYFHAATWIETRIQNSSDPNHKYGPGGASQGHYLNNNNPMSYVINFENDTTANTAVQTVRVIDTLDAAAFDYSTFGFTGVNLGESTYSLPAPATSFVHDFDFRQLYGVDARVVGIFDNVTGVAEWTIYTIDTLTQQITTNATAGFLPPDTASPKGQGNVTFTVSPKSTVQSGDTIRNSASIIFDFNAPVVTGNWQNIFDLIKPQSVITSATTAQGDSSINVSWAGSDSGSGIAGYDIYYSINNGPYLAWLANSSATDSIFTGNFDSTYCFYSVAYDSAANYEDAPLSPDVCATLTVGIQSLSMSETFLSVYPNPAFDKITVSFKLKKEEKLSLKITNLVGQNVINKILNSKEGVNKYDIDLEGCNDGIYILELKFSNETAVRKLVKL